MLQVQHQLVVTGAHRATIACLIGGQRLVWCDVERDEQTIARIVARGSAFWRCVESGEEPRATDLASVRALHPRDDGSEVALDAEADDLIERIEAEQMAQKLVTGRIEAAKARLAQLMGPARLGATGGGRVVTWTTSERAGYTVAPTTVRTLAIRKQKKDR